jgi:hypothetical protein
MTTGPGNGTDADARPPAGREQAGRLQPVIEVAFDRPDRIYAARDPLTVRYRVLGPATVLRVIEQSVVWYTEGKGEEDLGVHHFTRVSDRKALAAGDEMTFATTLPASPLSYEGVIVKIRWCVRIRVFFPGGRDFVSEHVFEVGRVPPARPPRIPGRVETTA